MNMVPEVIGDKGIRLKVVLAKTYYKTNIVKH